MSDYWAKRQAVDDAYSYFTKAEHTADDIGKVYQKASGYISNQAEDIFQRYRTRYNLSEAEARRLINTLRDQTSIDELLKKLQSVEQTEAIADLRKEIEASAFAARLERLRQLQNNLNLVMRQVYQQELKAQTKFYIDLANEAYYRSMFRMQQQANAAFTFNLIDEQAIDRVLNTNWSGKHYSTRIWNNTQGLAQTLKRELLTSLVTGRPLRETAQIIANKFAVGANAARRLVRTETNYVSDEINALAYKDAGVEEYQFLATLDLRTSEICREHDGKIYKVKDRVVGENFPPLHPWCRSTTVSVIDRKLLDKMTRSAIDPKTGKRIKVPRTMNYAEWYKKYVEGHEKEIEAREKVQKGKSLNKPKKKQELFKDITSEWKAKEPLKEPDVVKAQEYKASDGTIYKVDGKNVVFEHTSKEFEAAEIVSKEGGVRVEMLPKVNKPENVPSPDCLVDGVPHEIKAPEGNGSRTIKNRVYSAKGQADKVILDLRNCGLSQEAADEQIEKMLGSSDVRFMTRLIVINKDGELDRVFDR